MVEILKKKGTSRGIKVHEHKVTADSPLEAAPLPEKVIIPMLQNLGAPCEPLVKPGDRVLTGQKIGDSDKFVSAPVHASISGEVSAVATIISKTSGQPITALVITSDKEDRWVELTPAAEPDKLTKEEILAKIRAAGLVGLGGATFPTHVKLSPPKDKKIDTVILNGCECEPFITADHRVMLEYGEQVLSGLALIKKVLDPEKVYIAIEDNKPDAIAHMARLVAQLGYEKDFTIAPLKSKYPTGAEKVLIKILLGREVPIGGLPLDVGVVVQNINTARAIHEAVYEGKPLIEAFVTVTGAVKNPKNLRVRLGTSVKDIIAFCGGLTGQAGAIILGGPMMGICQPDLDYPVTKGSNCILVQGSNVFNERDCINCGACLQACPMRMMPTLLAKYAKAGRYEDCQKYFAENCCECGVCSYVCPANIPIVQYIKLAKSEIAKSKAAKK